MYIIVWYILLRILFISLLSAKGSGKVRQKKARAIHKRVGLVN